MKLTRGPMILGVVLAGAAGLAQAQGLGDAARREKERRAKVAAKQEKAKTFTNEDIEGRSGSSDTPSDAPEPGAEGALPVIGVLGVPAERGGETGRGESYWRQRFQSARSRVADAERQVASAERTVGGSSPGPLPPRCPPRPQGQPEYGVAFVPPPSGMTCEEVDLAWESRAGLAAAQRQLEGATKALADLEEDARRQGALPGWTR